MNQLSGKCVNVVLAVEEGKGMDFVRHPVNIIAHFNGRALESDAVKAEDCPAFDTELVWEISKKELRKIRSGNKPLRVECSTCDPERGNERVGFLLLSLRSAQIVPLSTDDYKGEEIRYKWHRLLCVQSERKSCHPELYLSLTIKDRLINPTGETIDAVMPFITEITEDEHITSCESGDVAINNNGSKNCVQCLENGYIRIGNEKFATENFCLSILTKTAENLDLLLPESLVFKNNTERFHMTFKIFDFVIKTKPFLKELNERIDLNEKIVVRMLTNLPTLKEFFEDNSVEVGFFCGNEKLGSTTMRLNGLIQDETDEEFCNAFTCNDQYYFCSSLGGDLKLNGAKPLIDVEINLSRVTEKKCELDSGEKSIVKTVVSNIEKTIERNISSAGSTRAGGDQELSPRRELRLGKLSKTGKKSLSEPKFAAEEVKNKARTKSLDTIMKNVSVTPPNYDNLFKISEYYESYCLEIILESIFWKKLINYTQIVIKFLHPKSLNYTSELIEIGEDLGEDVPLNLKFRIFYISKEGRIRHLLKAWSPRIILTDEKDRMITDECEVSTRLFYDSPKDDISYSADLKAIRTLEPISKLRIEMHLEKLDQFIIKEDDFSDVLTPPVIDELILLEEINDMEKWKEIEKEKFKQELARKAEKAKLQWKQEWTENRNNLEEKLIKQAKKCKDLQVELKRLLNHLRTLQALKKTSKKPSDPKLASMKYSNRSQKELIEMIVKLEVENEQLKEIVAEQRQKFEAFQKSALTREQTGSLLQELRGLEEKFSEAQEAKQYFKDQWKKACEEIHELKTEDYKQLQTQIKQDREELSQLSLDNFINGDNGFMGDCLIDDLYAREGLETYRKAGAGTPIT